MRSSTSVHVLLAALAIGLGLRLHNLNWGPPEFWHVDEVVLIGEAETISRCTGSLGTEEFSDPKSRCVPEGRGRWARFVYPHFFPYILSGVLPMLSPPPSEQFAFGRETSLQRGRRVRAGRLVSTLFGLATIVPTFVIARVLFGPTRAAIAALLLAVMPYHAVYAHIVTIDIPLTFWVTASAMFSVLAMKRSSMLFVACAGLMAGFAMGTKYPGILVLAPLFVSVPMARRQAGKSLMSAEGAIAIGSRWLVAGLSAAIGFAMVCPLCLLQYDIWLAAMKQTNLIHRSLAPLARFEPAFVPFARELFAILPFIAGWAIYLLALVAIPLAFRSRNGAVLIPIAIILPFVWFSSLSPAAHVRYALPAAPALCILASAAFPTDWSGTAKRSGWGAVLVAVLLYSGAVTFSLANNYSVADRDMVLDAIEARVRERYGDAVYQSGLLDQKVEVAQLRFAASFFGLRKMEPRRSVRLVQHHLDQQELKGDGADYIVLDLPNYRRVGTQSSPAGETLRKLDRGELGYELVASYEPHFFSDGLYIDHAPWLRPSYHRGLVGFRLYERTDPAPRNQAMETTKENTK